LSRSAELTEQRHSSAHTALRGATSTPPARLVAAPRGAPAWQATRQACGARPVRSGPSACRVGAGAGASSGSTRMGVGTSSRRAQTECRSAPTGPRPRWLCVRLCRQGSRGRRSSRSAELTEQRPSSAHTALRCATATPRPTGGRTSWRTCLAGYAVSRWCSPGTRRTKRAPRGCRSGCFVAHHRYGCRYFTPACANGVSLGARRARATLAMRGATAAGLARAAIEPLG
jgi:hypothetical protein